MIRAINPRLLGTLAAGIAVLALDSVTPRGAATWLLHIVLVWTALSWASRRELMIVGLWCAACADAGYWLSPRSGLSLWLDLVNQVLCVAAILLLVHAGLEERATEAARKAAEAEIRILRGLLSICATCKRIRDNSGKWEQLEVYIKHHSEAEFTHGLCPDCAAAFEREMEAE